ncbi:MADS-box transcription factor 51-like isoform X2 [Brachypodium distachyon]|uniref:MADS-box transcription factor 51-like isoform X2 n=1 Tax=Brachypodium distachyon TaxID=15368 RepID=UPI000D0D88FA|nr:MADS-box transcription factor 51-like isoform X2 [Brachypodium distachyon]|eukprot:XP_024310715.1 MADS-box transcription factor 51-like isoform X2 [Brachypodium distachyon]
MYLSGLDCMQEYPGPPCPPSLHRLNDRNMHWLWRRRIYIGVRISNKSIEGTYDRYQQFAGAVRNKYRGGASTSNNEDPSDIQSRLREITAWSLHNNTDEADASNLEKLEKLLTDALRITESKKVL